MWTLTGIVLQRRLFVIPHCSAMPWLWFCVLDSWDGILVEMGSRADWLILGHCGWTEIPMLSFLAAPFLPNRTAEKQRGRLWQEGRSIQKRSRSPTPCPIPWSSAQAGEKITLAPFMEFVRKPLDPASLPFNLFSSPVSHSLAGSLWFHTGYWNHPFSSSYNLWFIIPNFAENKNNDVQRKMVPSGFIKCIAQL